MQEFWMFLEKISDIDTKNILEIGIAHGGTTIFWQVIGDNVVSVDKRDFEGGISKDRLTTTLVLGDSHLSETLDKVRQHIPEVDVLFIDGDHSYDGCRQDWEMYSPLVRPGGVVAFHDINYRRVSDFDSEMATGRVFDEIELLSHQRKEEIVISHGIGMVWV
jgi:predicted O-methyltransferase YrrM